MALRAAGVDVIDPRLPAAAIVRRTPLVVTNASSSVLAEAAEGGHRPMCVLTPEAAQEFAGDLGCLDVVVCGDADFSSAVHTAGVVREPSAPFDVLRFVDAVEGMLAERRHG